MTDIELIKWCEEEAKGKKYITFTEDIFLSLSLAQSELIVKKFGSNTLLMLPEKEISFFNWLKEQAPEVWDDLWGNLEIGEELYTVAIGFLPKLLEKARGFPICDLLNSDNYYFTKSHIITPESEMMLDSVKERFMAHQPLTIGQLLILEISVAPIDIWRFAYNHNLKIEDVKKAVENLVEDKVLIHLNKAEHLAAFVE
ncbi:MAG: hypothetical protein EPN82_14180 [Bacteroidetes bacterium]|nr:MAG: hypothetical protein EPN82_14180 [Bacteroidota bacterium]